MHPFIPFFLYVAAATAFPTLNHYILPARRDALASLPRDQAANPVVAGRQLSLPNGGVRTLQALSSTSTLQKVPTPTILIGGKHTLSSPSLSRTTTHQSTPAPTILIGGEHTLAPNSASSAHQEIAPPPLHIVTGGERPLGPSQDLLLRKGYRL